MGDVLRAAGPETLDNDSPTEAMVATPGRLEEHLSPAGQGEEKGEPSTKPRSSKATRAVGYAVDAGIELWHDPDGEPYADVRGADGIRRTMRVRSRVCRTWLAGLMYAKEGAAALQEYVSTQTERYDSPSDVGGVDITDWRRVCGT